MKRRELIASGLLLGSTTRASAGEPYPGKPVRWVVPYPAGACTDAAARVIGKRLSERLGQQFIIDNKTGAGSNIGTEIVANAPADGHTLLFISTANVINASLYKTLPSTSAGTSCRWPASCACRSSSSSIRRCR